ncbi:MAG: ROK family transcriptional regulator [Armatimonadetes bacterium]|nr:ROK family transcriptional regulator [Armatimonadota bacterium]
MNVLQSKDTIISNLNDSAVLDAVRRLGPIASQDVAEIVGLSKPTVSRVVARLIESGLIEVVGHGPASSAGGRKSRLLQISSGSGSLVGVDVGALEIRAVLTDLRHRALAKAACPVQDRYNRDRIVSQVKNIIAEVVADGGSRITDIKGGAIGATGLVDMSSGEVVVSPNLPGLNRVNLQRELSDFPFPIYVSNEMNTHMLGERYFDPSLSEVSFMSVLWGYGIGVNVILHDSEIVSGRREQSWDIGHITLVKDGAPCHCGRRGCLEAYAAGWALELKVQTALGGEDAGVTVEDARRLIAGGDPRIRQILREAGETLGKTLAPFVQFFAPDALILAGGVVRADESVVDAVRRGLESRINLWEVGRIDIRASRLDKFAGALGATKIIAHHLLKAPLLNILVAS